MAAPRCVVLTQDAYLSRFVRLLLDHGDYELSLLSSASVADAEIRDRRPHLAVLDIDIDDGAGIQLVGRWKAEGTELPVIGLTRRDTIEARLGAFERGIDDLLVVPFPPEELIARCVGVMQRVHGRDVRFRPEVTVGDLRIDLLHERLTVDGHALQLTRIEKALLYILAANAGEILTRDQLLGYIWGYDRDVGSNLIDRHIADLRAKVARVRRDVRLIETVAGEGYRFRSA